MNALRYGIAVGLLAGLGACSNMMGGGSGQASHPVAMAQPTVAPAMVKQVQSKLRDSGYYKQGAIDGVWGSDTQAAVRAYQRDHNLTANGELDVPTLQALNVATGSAATANPAANGQTTNNPGPTQPMGTTPAPNTPPAATNNTVPPAH